jgi:predicted CXXCH cytochrome family protein
MPFFLARGITGLAAAVLAVALAAPALARVSGPCGNCHTMHNSQDGGSMASTLSGTSRVPDETPNGELLKSDCIGCHSATDSTTWKDPVTGAPIVYNTAEPTYGADAGDGQRHGLAAGNFYWVTRDSSFGHNIFSPDPTLTKAPGKYSGCSGWSCHVNLDRPYTLGGRARKNCTCCHTFPSNYHHNDDSATVVNSRAQGWYRFLGSVHFDGHGASGIESPDWEHSATSTSHNEYLGAQKAAMADMSGYTENGNTVTAFCSGCHNSIHANWRYVDEFTGEPGGPALTPWIRHPADRALPAGGEYTAYTVYDPLVPVARPALTTISGTVTPGTDMVMCLSCHRAHASPYPDMLRFPYDQMQAGGGGADGTGCFKCHTAKDGS